MAAAPIPRRKKFAVIHKEFERQAKEHHARLADHGRLTSARIAYGNH